VGEVRYWLRVFGAVLAASAFALGVVVTGATAASASGSVTITVTGTVDTTTPSAANCLPQGADFTCPTLRDAVAYAVSPPVAGSSTAVVVDLSSGEYQIGDQTGEQALDVSAGNLTLTGTGVSETVVEGGGGAQLLTIASTAAVSLQDISLDGGTGPEGGDVYNDGNLSVSDATISGGYAADGGGGIYNDAGATLILGTGVTVTGDATSADGGGIYNAGSATLTGATLSGDLASSGGGIYNGVEGSLSVGTGTTLDGNSAATTAGGGGIFNDGSLVVAGATIEGNSTHGVGGGIYNASSAPVTVSDSTINGNSATSRGGGIYNDEGTLIVTDSTVSDNTAAITSTGAGIDNEARGQLSFSGGDVSGNAGEGIWNGGVLAVSGSTISGNSLGAGIDNESSEVGSGALDGVTGAVLSDVTISGNSGGAGGGIDNGAAVGASTLTVSSSTISGNLGEDGGGIDSHGTFTATNSTLSGNSTESAGGSALYADSSSATMSFDTIADNPGPTGTVSIDNVGGGSVKLASSVLAYAPGKQCAGTVSNGGGNVATDSSCGLASGDGKDPGLLPLADNGGTSETMAIGSATSPAVNTTTGSICKSAGGETVSSDQLGRPRPTTIGGVEGCDAGAYQLQAAPAASKGAATAAVTLGVAGTGDTASPSAAHCSVSGSSGTCPTLRDAVAYANSKSTTAVAVDLSSGEYRLADGALKVSIAKLTLCGAGTAETVVEAGGMSGDDILSITESSAVVSVEHLTLDGGNGADTHGDDSGAGDVYNEGTLSLLGAGVTGGFASGNSTTGKNGGGGGGIYNDAGATLILSTGTTVTGDATSADGGGIYNAGSATVGASQASAASVSDDSAALGGGIYNGGHNAGLALGRGAVLAGDSALIGGGSGGGIYNGASGLLSVTGSNLTGDSAEVDGGAIYNESSVGSDAASVSGATISGSGTAGDGGGIYNGASGVTATLSITDSTVTGDFAIGGAGGIDNEGTIASITNSVVSEDSAVTGGGGIINDGTIGSISGSTLSGDSVEGAGFGGALENTRNATITGSTLTDDTAPSGYGGAVWNSDTLGIDDSLLVQDSASFGGGIDNDRGTVALTDSTVSQDSSGSDGSALYNDGGVTSLSFDTLADNPAPPGAGSVDNVDKSEGTVALASSVLAYAPADQCSGAGTVTDGGGNIATDSSCSLLSGNGVDPELLPLAGNGGATETMAIGSDSSPAVNTTPGPNCEDAEGDAVSTDQRGYPRPTTISSGAGCDAGAYQLAAPGTTSSTATEPSSTTGTITALPDSGVPIGTALYDAATVSSNSPTVSPSGTVQFYICPPATLSVYGSTTCDSTIGSSFESETLPVGPESVTVFSKAQTVTSTGTWCLAADYSGDDILPPSSDASSNECFTVTKGTAAVATTATGANFGGNARDTVTVTGAGVTPTGSATFYYCFSATVALTKCSSPVTKVDPGAEPVALAGGKATSPSLSIADPGYYCFFASYSGDSNYDGPTTSESGSECFRATRSPSVTSAAGATASVGHSFSFVVRTTGYPLPSITETGMLPKGLHLVDNHNGTATISGTATAGSGGRHGLTLKAANSAGSATQSFVLTVDQAPAVTSAATATATIGHDFSFMVRTTGYPPASIAESGTLPKGLHFVNNHNGTATISGTAAAGSSGHYKLALSATNSIGSAKQTFVLTVS
jgi:hypothetical protein